MKHSKKSKDNMPQQMALFDTTPYWKEVGYAARRKPWYYIRRHMGATAEEIMLCHIDRDGRGHWRPADFRMNVPVVYNSIQAAQVAARTHGGYIDTCHKATTGEWYTE